MKIKRVKNFSVGLLLVLLTSCSGMQETMRLASEQTKNAKEEFERKNPGQTQNNNSSPLPNLFRQKEQKRIVVMETANREVTLLGNSVAIPNSYNLCKEHFSAISTREFDAILANGGRVVGSPSDIRENSFDVSLGNSSGWTLGCQMRDYIIEQ